MWRKLSIIVYIIVCLLAVSCSNEGDVQSEGSAPVPEITIECSNSNANSLTITYLPDEGAAGYYYSMGSDPSIGTKVENDNEHSVTYSNLTPNTRYTFSSVAWNKKGEKGSVATLQARTKNKNVDDNKTNYVTVNGKEYKLFSARMLIEGKLATTGLEDVFYKVLQFEGEKGFTINLQEKQLPQVIPYTERWKSGSYPVINSEEYNVYTCIINLNSQPYYVEGTISLSCSDNELAATFNCGNLQGNYNGKYTTGGVIWH